MTIFSSRLKAVRIDKGLTQSDVAKKLGVSQGTYANWENGKREPNLETVREISRLLTTPTDYLFGLDVGKDTDSNYINQFKEDLEQISQQANDLENLWDKFTTKVCELEAQNILSFSQAQKTIDLAISIIYRKAESNNLQFIYQEKRDAYASLK